MARIPGRRPRLPALFRLAVSTQDQFDLVVVGAGPAGEKGAAQAAYFGKRVCVIERAPKPGGAAVNMGIPAKALRESALFFSGLRQRGLFGMELRVQPGISLADFLPRERHAVDAAWEVIHQNLQAHGVESIQGTARFVDSHSVEVTRYGQPARRVTGGHFLLAPGAAPQAPVGFTVDDDVIVDSASVLTLQRIPSSMIVVGGGAIGCEYACTFAALGVRVTLVHSRSRLLSHLDHDVSDAVRQAMTGRLNITVLGEVDVRSVQVSERRAHVTLTDGLELSADVVLACTGRVGNAGALDVESVGIRTSARRFVQVDGQYRTAVPHIFAAGDVIGGSCLASAAMEQARVAVCHMFDVNYKRQVSDVLPSAVWTIPEIATVGEAERSLLARGVPCETGMASYRLNTRGQMLGETDGFVKLVFHPEDQRLLGVTIVGEGAVEGIHIGMTVIALGGTLDFFIQSAFNYPSLADAYKYAAYDGVQRLGRRRARYPGLPSVPRALVPD